MSVDTPDPVLPQLKKLREGVGLTANRLAQSGAVMSALSTSDPVEAQRRLVEILDGLGGADYVHALKVDFGLDLKRFLTRAPTQRELELLGERRNGFAVVAGRDVKTLARWSDKAVGELRAQLLNDQFNGDLLVMAHVRGDRILGCTVFQGYDNENQPELKAQSSFSYKNPAEGPSMPCLLYAYPREWRPGSLALAVSFDSEPRPGEVWGVVGDSVFSLVYGERRYPLVLRDNVAICKFVGPRTDRLYGVWWR
jgi:hypothetical protein